MNIEGLGKSMVAQLLGLAETDDEDDEEVSAGSRRAAGSASPLPLSARSPTSTA